MPELGSLSFLFGPAVAFLAVGFLALVLRWVYATPPTVRRVRRPGPGEARDYGLLTPVAAVATQADGLRLRGLLADHGIRATLGDDEHGQHRVLVFAADAERARELVVHG
ncbi:MAG: DUF2007 domain-containing protein [Actinomycetota bacterium]|nr:DUF2007 domain-containing protein [Actinomycetota bacterium]